MCANCGQACNWGGGYSQACCGAGGGGGCQVGCQTGGNGCTAYALCHVHCYNGVSSSKLSKCSGASGGDFVGLPSTTADITSSGPGALAYTTSPKGEYTVTFDRPAVAVLVEVVHISSDGRRFTGVAKHDDFLRTGKTTIDGTIPTVVGPKGITFSSRVRVRYVEYLDGTTDGDITPEVATQEFEPLRERVRAQAGRYATQVKKLGRSRVAKMLAEERTAARVRAQDVNPEDLPEASATASFALLDSDVVDEMALAQVEAMFAEKNTDKQLAAKLEQLSR